MEVRVLWRPRCTSNKHLDEPKTDTQEFAFPKPMPNQKMIFLDRAAKRADAAVEAAKKAGFSQARAYGGGSKEFHQKSKKDGDDH